MCDKFSKVADETISLQCSDEIISLQCSKTIGWTSKTSPASRLFTQSFIQLQIKENIKALRHWPLWGEFTGDRWIPHTKGQWRGKCFHLMTSSYHTHSTIERYIEFIHLGQWSSRFWAVFYSPDWTIFFLWWVTIYSLLFCNCQNLKHF